VAIIGLRAYQAEDLIKAETDLSFTQADLGFTHQFDAKKILPFLGSAAFDANGDEKTDLFLGGGAGQDDGLFTFENGAFVPLDILPPKADESATHGAAHLDFDKDGDVDLFLARSNGVILLENKNGQYIKHPVTFPTAKNSVPLSIAIGDINGDNFADLYISSYIALDAVEGETIFTRPYGAYSKLFLGTPKTLWIEATDFYGLDEQHNRFTAGFVDLNDDAKQDLVIAQDTGVIETWEQTAGGKLIRKENPSVNSYPMGLGFGDINGDGRVDIWSSNVGHTLPGTLLRGDLPKDADFNTDYYLLENQGNFQFLDVAEAKEAAKLGFGWGSVIEDIDLDGREDLLAAQNYARLPGNGILRHYPGKILLQQDDMGFADATHIAPDKGFGITPLVADFSQDGAPDIVWANLAGRSRAWISESGFGNSVTIKLPDQTEFLGALIEVTDSSGKTRTKQLVAGEGLGSDMSRDLIFGFGEAKFQSAKIMLRHGETKQFDSAPNGIITWK